MKKMSKLFLMFLMVFSFALTNVTAIIPSGTAFACDPGDGSTLPDDCKTAGKDVNKQIYKFGATLSGVVVGIALLFVIYGGFKYVTSQGDPRQTETAKSQILFAGIGMLIVMMAFVVMKLFMGAAGADGTVGS